MVEQKHADMKHLFVADAMRSQSGLAKAARLGSPALSTCMLHLQDLAVAIRMTGWSDLERQVDTWTLLLKNPAPMVWSMLAEWTADLGYLLNQATSEVAVADVTSMHAWQGRLDAYQYGEHAASTASSSSAQLSQPPFAIDEVTPDVPKPRDINIHDGLNLLHQIRQSTTQPDVLRRISALQDWLCSLEHTRISEIGSVFAQAQDCKVSVEFAHRLTEHLSLLSKCAPLNVESLGSILRIEMAHIDTDDVTTMEPLAKDLHGQVFKDKGGWILQFPTDHLRTSVQPFTFKGDKYAVLSAQLVPGAKEMTSQITLRSGTQTLAFEVEEVYAPVSARLFWVPDWVKRPPWLNAIALDDSDQTYLCVIPK